MKAGIVDYGMGNLASLSKAVEAVGVTPLVSPNTGELIESDVLILPGVGNFEAGMRNLTKGSLSDLVVQWAGEGKPLFGICLGMQLLFDSSEEGELAGLGILPGRVVKLNGGLKVPHMGWNSLSSSSNLFKPFNSQLFYFVHSYVCVPDLGTSAVTVYGEEFASAVEHERIVGVQFHPEKSSRTGLELLRVVLESLT